MPMPALFVCLLMITITQPRDIKWPTVVFMVCLRLNVSTPLTRLAHKCAIFYGQPNYPVCPNLVWIAPSPVSIYCTNNSLAAWRFTILANPFKARASQSSLSIVMATTINVR